MNRDAIARSRRRDQALEVLAFEREREAALRDQLEEVVLEQEGARIDREAYARMEPDDVAVVRTLLADSWSAVDEDEEEDARFLLAGDGNGLAGDGNGLAGEDDENEEHDEDEVARLQGEIESCRARQRALERYVEALAAPAAEV